MKQTNRLGLLVAIGLAASLGACADAPSPVATTAPSALPGEGPAYGGTGRSDAPVTSTTGASGTMGQVPTSMPSPGATPRDDSNSASARGGPGVSSGGRGRGTGTTTRARPGATPLDDSNSASARGGPGTGAVTGTTR